MNIPEPLGEGYIVRVTEENHECLSEVSRMNLSPDYILNYDPSMGNLPSNRFFAYRKSDEDNLHITADSTKITVEQLQQILFIESLEN